MKDLLDDWHGKESELQFMLGKTMKRNETVLVDLSEACDQENHEQIKFIAHKLKFIAKYFHLSSLQTQIDKIEHAYAQNLKDTVIKNGRVLQTEIKAAQTLLYSMIEKLNVSK